MWIGAGRRLHILRQMYWNVYFKFIIIVRARARRPALGIIHTLLPTLYIEPGQIISFLYPENRSVTKTSVFLGLQEAFVYSRFF